MDYYGIIESPMCMTSAKHKDIKYFLFIINYWGDIFRDNPINNPTNTAK